MLYIYICIYIYIYIYIYICRYPSTVVKNMSVVLMGISRKPPNAVTIVQEFCWPC